MTPCRPQNDSQKAQNMSVFVQRRTRLIFCAFCAFLWLVNAVGAQTPKPRPAPSELRPLLGEYVSNNQTVIVLEKDGKLYGLSKQDSQSDELKESLFTRDPRGQIKFLNVNGVIYERRPLGPEEGANQ